jgi:hypothetical protein
MKPEDDNKKADGPLFDPKKPWLKKILQEARREVRARPKWMRDISERNLSPKP